MKFREFLKFFMENFLSNCSFFLLLCCMSFYWIRAFFNIDIFFSIGKLTIIGANLTMFFLLIYRGFNENHFPLSNLAIKKRYHSFKINFKSLFLKIKKIIACRVLLVKFKFKIHIVYEALIFLSWCFTLIHLIIESFFNSFIVGVITTPTALFLNAFASFKLPESFHQFSPLIPALKSNWLMMHVTVMLLSYATLICGSVLSIAFLFLFEKKFENFIGSYNLNFKTFFNKTLSNETQSALITDISILLQTSSNASANLNASNVSSTTGYRVFNPEVSLTQTSTVLENTEITTLNKKSYLETTQSAELIKKDSIENLKKDSIENQKINLLNTLDQLSFRAIGIGFPLLTIGILSGSVWANEAWGSYWSWDPKETWSFITWIVFAIYLHLRLTQKWNGVKSATIATIGFFVIWICFLGVNFLAKGLHSYGWFN
uniref:Cytochrome c biogenesis protein CcsA n=1 Tax=Pseudochlorodesmis sp. HV01306a TaxID=2358488 RepID=A0A386AXZ0_9CHLO|nr:cytochrome c biogenesis protein Ccs1 [Pseudochlorodesmis sp. HV01306a]